jgi:hypothetical protein
MASSDPTPLAGDDGAPESARAARARRRAQRLAHRLAPATAERVTAGCYGALVAASTLTGIGYVRLAELAGVVVITNVVYYATHVFAYSIADRSTEASALQSALHHIKVSAPMVSAAFVPLGVVLLLAAFGVATEHAVVGGVITAVLYLTAVAATGAHLRGLRPSVVVLTACLAVLVSGALVAAKLALH